MAVAFSGRRSRPDLASDNRWRAAIAQSKAKRRRRRITALVSRGHDGNHAYVNSSAKTSYSRNRIDHRQSVMPLRRKLMSWRFYRGRRIAAADLAYAHRAMAMAAHRMRQANGWRR